MPKPRKELVSLEATPYYHCVSRCVRRAFLCGSDNSGANFEHRRQWIENKLLALASVFAVDICAYAIMSNHYHLVLHIDRETALKWSMDEVIHRWHQLYRGTVLTQRYVQQPLSLTKAERNSVADISDQWRERLMSISWFMRILNESTARMANAEDQCTGRFWEGRFKSQALLDEHALAACMAYVDLNPIRANMANTPETSAHTSIQRRSKTAARVAQPNHPQQQAKPLLSFVGYPRQNMPKGLPFRLTDYLELVDWTGRLIRDDKRGAINSKLPAVLARLQIDPKHWVYLSQHFESRFKCLVGTAYKIKQIATELGYQRIPGMGQAIQTSA